MISFPTLFPKIDSLQSRKINILHICSFNCILTEYNYTFILKQNLTDLKKIYLYSKIVDNYKILYYNITIIKYFINVIYSFLNY